MIAKIWVFIKNLLLIIFKKILLFDLIAIGVILLSFLVFKGFTYTALSERLIWAGIGIALLGGLLIFSQTVGGHNFGLPGQFTQSVHGQLLLDFNIEMRQRMDKFFGLQLQLFLIGAVLFGIGVLVQVNLGK